MHIVYIEFRISKSKNYKNVCTLAKKIKNYSFDGTTSYCYIDSLMDYIRLQHTIYTIIDTIAKWKNSKILLFGKQYKTIIDYYEFLDSVRKSAGKYESLILDKSCGDVASEAITYEDLPLPIVYYPDCYGAFFGFSKDVGEAIYFCECQREAIERYIYKPNIYRSNPNYTYVGYLSSGNFPKIMIDIVRNSKKTILELFGFKENLCFRCNNKLPIMKYCHPMYGSVFKQRYGWYIKQEELYQGIHPHKMKNQSIRNEIENSVRERMGYPKIGDAWISETILFHIIEELYPDTEIIRHHRPKWLDGLELDVYVPSEKIAFEYQGIQHFKAIKHWGGDEKLLIQKEHDIRKKLICKERGIRLFCINYDEELTNDYVREMIENEKKD